LAVAEPGLQIGLASQNVEITKSNRFLPLVCAGCTVEASLSASILIIVNQKHLSIPGCAWSGLRLACVGSTGGCLMLELCKIGYMERDQVIAALKAHERELRMAGVDGVSRFGSVARGEDSAGDVDLAVRLGEGFSAAGLDYISRLSELEGRLSDILGCKVDIIEEPVRTRRFQREIDRDRALAF